MARRTTVAHRPIDAVVVLGAAVAAPDIPGPALVRRVEFGVDVFRRIGADHLLLSGGHVAAPPEEAIVMRRLAVALGIPQDRIVVETKARNTFENAVFSGAIIRARGWDKVVVVTDSYHLRRAMFVFRRLGLHVQGRGVPRTMTLSSWAWYRMSAVEMIRLAHSAYLFATGAHKPIIKDAWGVRQK